MADQGAIGKYRPLEPVGSGGFAVVYRALDTVLEREVALKVLKPQHLGDPEFVERFFREARTVARLDHPAIIRIFDVASSDGRAYIAMELASDSLAGIIARRGAMPWPEALALLRPVCEALDYAHSMGLVHRDLKPANVLISRRGQPLISDFGFARATADGSASFSLAGGVLGTPGYIAPEIWDGGEAGKPADHYALACIAYELITGQVLFKADTPARAVTAHVVEGPQFPTAWPPGVPAGVRDVLTRALQRSPEARFPTAMACFEALSALPSGALDAPPDPRPAPPDPRPAASQRGFLARLGGEHGCTIILALALLLAVGGLGTLSQLRGMGAAPGSTPTARTGVVAATVEPSAELPPTAAPASPAPNASPAAPVAGPTATIAPSPTPDWAAEPAELGRVLEGGGEGVLFRAVSRDRALTPDSIPDTPACLQGLVINADGSPARHFRVVVAGVAERRRADHDHLTGTYAICGLRPGDWTVMIDEYLHNPLAREERAGHAVSFHASGAPGEIFYISFQAREPVTPAAELFPPAVDDPGPLDQHDGRWVGELTGRSQGSTVTGTFAFEVREGKVVFTGSDAPPCPWGDPDLRTTVAFGFSFAGLSAGDGVYYELAGVFTSPTEAEGTLSADRDGVPCLSDAVWRAWRAEGNGG